MHLHDIQIIQDSLVDYQDIIESLKDFKPNIILSEEALEDDHRNHLEKEREQNLPRDTDKIFAESPESQLVIQEQLQLKKNKKEKLEQAITEKIKWIRINVPSEQKWFHELCLKMGKVEDLIELEKNIRRLKRLLPRRQIRLKNKVTDVDIARAKDISIADILMPIVELKRSGSNWKCLCPFHDEKTPSFVVFTKNNRCYCFGCHFTADSIGLVQKLENKSFLEAVRWLIKY